MNSKPYRILNRFTATLDISPRVAANKLALYCVFTTATLDISPRVEANKLALYCVFTTATLDISPRVAANKLSLHRVFTVCTYIHTCTQKQTDRQEVNHCKSEIRPMLGTLVSTVQKTQRIFITKKNLLPLIEIKAILAVL